TFRAALKLDNVLHLLAASISIAIWLIFRKRPPSARIVSTLDIASTIAVLTTYELGMSCGKSPAAARIDLIMMLIAMIVQMTRAIMVPSTVRQTLWIGVVTAFGSIFMTYRFVTSVTLQPDWPSAQLLVVSIALWNAMTVIVATMASRVVYGLHQQ